MTFQTFLFPLASCLPDTPLASTNKHPQGLPEYFIYSATSFLFCLYPCLPGLPPSSAVRAHHRCSLDPPFLLLDYLSERIFLRSSFLPTGLVIDAFHYPFLPFGSCSVPMFYLRCFGGYGRGFVFTIQAGEFSASVSLNCFLSLFFYFFISVIRRLIFLMHKNTFSIPDLHIYTSKISPNRGNHLSRRICEFPDVSSASGRSTATKTVHSCSKVEQKRETCG